MCEGIFSDASHCWPFNGAQVGKSEDRRGDRPAYLKVNRFLSNVRTCCHKNPGRNPLLKDIQYRINK